MRLGVGCPCPPIHNYMVTLHHLFFLSRTFSNGLCGFVRWSDHPSISRKMGKHAFLTLRACFRFWRGCEGAEGGCLRLPPSPPRPLRYWTYYILMSHSLMFSGECATRGGVSPNNIFVTLVPAIFSLRDTAPKI